MVCSKRTKYYCFSSLFASYQYFIRFLAPVSDFLPVPGSQWFIRIYLVNLRSRVLPKNIRQRLCSPPKGTKIRSVLLIRHELSPDSWEMDLAELTWWFFLWKQGIILLSKCVCGELFLKEMTKEEKVKKIQNTAQTVLLNSVSVKWVNVRPL